MDQMYKRGVEKMLEGELDAHLGYDKHERKEKHLSVVWCYDQNIVRS